MNSFNKNDIKTDIDIIPESLAAARRESGLELDEISKKLKIDANYLRALENGRFDLLPAGVYGKNFLKEYAKFLRLDYIGLAEIFEKETEKEKGEKEKKLFSKQTVKKRDFLTAPKFIKAFALIAVVSVCFFYLAASLKDVVSPPILEVDYPAENIITDKDYVDVVGRTEPEAEITINGEAVATNGGGKFSQRVNLKEGLNIIDIAARKKHGRASETARQVLVK